ncbi:hypothetical protein IAQ61_004539 [Plenodomus lingam]|uniref:uncharacterized protein n=1 Tax=Leptosphaeria maculans TaxID=5022 RepID=UPI0033308557|nr:hypothetical protein IAQ61_004539 [Plenodomus lingam]
MLVRTRERGKKRFSLRVWSSSLGIRYGYAVKGATMGERGADCAIPATLPVSCRNRGQWSLQASWILEGSQDDELKISRFGTWRGWEEAYLGIALRMRRV